MPKIVSVNNLMDRFFVAKGKSGNSLQETLTYLASLGLHTVCPTDSRILNIRFASRETGAYTKLWGSKGDKYMIVIGGGMVLEITGIPTKYEDIDEIKKAVPKINNAIYGLFHHECGHYFFTDMIDRSIIDYPESRYRNFIHQMFNTLEDPVVEWNMTKLYKTTTFKMCTNPNVHFKYLKERIFEPQCAKYTDHGDVQSFLNYILLCVRCGKSEIRNHCAVYDKYEADLVPLMKAILMEPDPTERIHKTITLCEWCIEHIKELDFATAEKPTEIISGKGGGSGKTGATPGSYSGPGHIDDDPGTGSSGKPGDEEEDDDEDDEEDDDEKEEEEEEDEKEEEEEEDETPPEFVDEIEDVLNDDMVRNCEHEFHIAKNEFYVKSPSLIDNINQLIEKGIEPAQIVSKFFKSFKDRIREQSREGFRSGKLNIRRAMRNEANGGCDLKLFNKNITGGEDVDLAVYLVTDNSGSMGGEKSEICAQACAIFAQACEWSGIPFEVAAFTKTFDGSSGISQTIIEKGFEDTFEASKPFFAVNSSSLIRDLAIPGDVRTFCGNSEEVNLYHIWKNFRKVDHKQKLMIVMCDGQTTGSVNDLKNVLKSIEDEGIMVIGIGICSTDVERIYNHNKVFTSISALREGLAPYMVDVLSGYLAEANHR